jgi:hypothetical protein
VLGLLRRASRLQGRRLRRLTELKNDAAPQARVPAITTAANHRGRYYNSRSYDRGGWCYDSRCYDSRCSRCYDSRSHDNWRRGNDYDWTSIRETSSVRTTMKARTTSTRSACTVNIDD